MAIDPANVVTPMWTLDPATGLLAEARQLTSPNFDERPDGVLIEAVIIHAISLPPGQYGGAYVEQFFCNQLDTGEDPYFTAIADVKVSSHFLILRNGDLLQFVPTHQRAWHAGVSCCMGRDAVNDFSIGIELEGCDDDTFETAQYQSLIDLTRALISAIPTLSEKHIYGHAEIAPGRKTDPGPGFDWPAYRLALSSQDYQVAESENNSL